LIPLPKKDDFVLVLVPPTVAIEYHTLVYAHQSYLESFHCHRLLRWLGQRCRKVELIDSLGDPESAPVPVGTRVAGPRSIRPENLQCYYFGLTESTLRSRLERMGRPDQVWVTCNHVYNRETVHQTIGVVRGVYPDATVLLGGVYASLCPEDAELSGADYVFRGILEESEQVISVQRGATGFVIVGRGCPNRCSFCAQHLIENSRFMNPIDRILEDVDQMIDRGMSLLFPYTSSLYTGLRPEDAENLMEELSHRDLSLLLWTGLHPKSVTYKRANLLKRAGAIDIMVPLQTLEVDTARKWGRNDSVQTYLDALSRVRDAGFRNEIISSDVLVGHPEQTLEEAIRSACFVWSQGVSPLLFSYALVPGSADEKKFGHLARDIPLEQRHPFLWTFSDPRHPVYHFMQFNILGRVMPELIERALEYLDPDTPVPGLVRRYLDEFGFDVPQFEVRVPLPKLRPGFQSQLSHPFELMLTLLQRGHAAAADRLVDRCEGVDICAPHYLEIPLLFRNAGYHLSAVRTLDMASRWLPLQARSRVQSLLVEDAPAPVMALAKSADTVARALSASGLCEQAERWRSSSTRVSIEAIDP